MAFKLRVGNTLSIPIKLEINDGGPKPAPFSFRLTAKRLSADDLRDIMQNTGEQADQPVPEFLHRQITGWSGQTLVMADEAMETPAEFGREAFDAMLSLPGVAGVIYGAYITELIKAAPPEAARKN